MPHSEDPLLKAEILLPVENNAPSLDTNCHESSVNGAVFTPSAQPLTDAGFDVRPEGITAVGSIDLPTETDGDSKTASGFMLISVRHLSKAGPGDLRNQSVSLPLKCRRSGSEPLQYNIFEPSHEDSSPTSSQSHAGEDEYSNDGFYGSGSIEAEEFEDDELDEDEAAHSVTLVVGASGKNLKSSLLKSATRPDASFFSSSIREVKRNSFASPTTAKFGNDRCRVISSSSDSAIRGAWVTPNERVQQGTCTLFTFPASGHFHSSRRRHRPVAPHGRYVVGKHDLVTKFQPIYSTLLPLVATAHVQTNTSHFDSQVLACTPIPVTSVHTAPPSGHVSPPQPSEYTIMLEPLSLPEPYINGHVHSQSFSSHSVNHDSPTLTLHPPMYSLCNGPAHAPNSGSTQQPVACPHHLHPGGATELPPNSLIDGSNTNDGHLVPTVPALNSVTIPNLQPASRFRKARIHETVEQWSHGRASIHDCHLKAVPDWVWDLQKKSSTLEQDVASALFQKINCSSCLEIKVQAPNHSGSQQTHVSAVSRQTGFSDTPRSNTSNLFASKSEIVGGTSVLGHDTYRGNLFSFWDGGCRVNARLFNASRSAIPRHLPSDEMGFSSVCPICAGVVAGNAVEPSKDNLPEKTVCIDGSVVNADRSDQCGQAIKGDPSLLQDIKFASGQTTGLGSSSTLSTPALLPSKSADPATAYLIHQQISPVTGIIMVSTDSAPKYIASPSPSAVPAHQSPSGRMHGSHLGNGTQNQYKSRPGECIQPPLTHKRDLSQDISGFAPPTSPALVPPGDAQSVWSAVSCESFVTRGTANGFSHGAESNLDVPTNRPHLEAQAPINVSLPGDDHHPVMRLRDASGRYHNVAPMDSVYVTNGLDGRSTERPWTNLLSPMSPSDIYKTVTNDSRSATDAPKGPKTTGRFPSPAVSKRYNTSLGSLEPCYLRSRSSTKSVPSKFYRESKSSSRGRLTLSKRLEARISESVNCSPELWSTKIGQLPPLLEQFPVPAR
ncbi:hypothetical protein CRM22_007393 [Opisthorchis felineus]|uniref:Uncharacterized protein n=1 Tax=Opisthorchis felineus TaxID=147828 RepID=A0A4S2LPF0_OPIFE|nr:hypothetical protein CRM22_007393 [Opisthorchis felineus]